MNINSNIHTHTTYCDGGATAEEMIRQAIRMGYRSIGFSGHVYLDFDHSYCMTKEGTLAYVWEVRALAKTYEKQIEVLCGIEQDCFSNEPVEGYDFVLGACHYVCENGVCYPVDESPAAAENAIHQVFHDEPLAYTANYFDCMAHLADKTQPDVVAHFDLVTKFNEGNRLFSEDDPEYRKPALAALEALADKGCLRFEVNTGAIYRRCRTTPYPAMFLLKALKELGRHIVFGSDSHSVPSLGDHFAEAIELAKEAGFREADILTKAGFISVPL